MSKREEIRKKRQQESRNQRMLMIGAVVVAAVLIAAIFIVPNLLATNPESYTLADGRALGPRDAKVTIEEFSDFQ